jgi:hypothetical protein
MIYRFNDFILEKSIGSEEIRKKWYSHFEKKLFYKIINLDPTSIRKKDFSKPGKYSKWLLMQFDKGNLSEQLLNDESYHKKLNYYLFVFSTGWYKNKIKKEYGEEFFDEEKYNKYKNYNISKSFFTPSSIFYDINKFKTVSDFVKHIEDYKERYEIETEETKFDTVYSNDKITILVPLNFTASYETAKNTDWCTKSVSSFSEWNKKAILFRILENGTNNKLKITWTGNNNWFIAHNKYPEISNLEDFNDYKPFDKKDDKEIWLHIVEKRLEMFPKFKHIYENLITMMMLLNEECKQKIINYWKLMRYNKI